MPDATDGMPPTIPVPAASLRRCPGCHNQVTAQTPRCPVGGAHAVVARVATAARWLLIATAIVTLIWWFAHHG